MCCALRHTLHVFVVRVGGAPAVLSDGECLPVHPAWPVGRRHLRHAARQVHSPCCSFSKQRSI